MKRQAFTLVELLVVIAIIGLLSTVAVVATNASRISARNTQRKANLVQMSKALELYYADNGAYPDTGGVWHGPCTLLDSSPDTGAGAWIPNFTSYMTPLPHDPNTNMANPNSGSGFCRPTTGWNCYAYRSDGIDYKLLALCTPEGTMSATDHFYDPLRPTWAWQFTNKQSTTSGW